MKLQDLLFIVLTIVMILMKNSKLSVIAGLVSLSLAISLFAFWVFFTAERLTMYAAGFFILAILLQLIHSFRKDAKVQ